MNAHVFEAIPCLELRYTEVVHTTTSDSKENKQVLGLKFSPTKMYSYLISLFELWTCSYMPNPVYSP
jgi:hypothetical protein